MFEKIVVVIGATGIQGGSVISTLLQDSIYKIRGITRNTNSAKSQLLASKGVEMVEADLNDEASLVKAFEVNRQINSTTKPPLTTHNRGPTQFMQ